MESMASGVRGDGGKNLRVRLRDQVRQIRDKPALNWMLRQPFLALTKLGVEVPQRIFQHLPYRGVFEVVGVGAGFKMRSYGDSLENSLYWRGPKGYEAETFGPWTRLAERARVVLDIGSNTGLFSLLAAAVGGATVSVYAFEPLTRIAARARLNAQLNPNFRIRVIEAAVSSACGRQSIYDPGGSNCYSASLDPSFLTTATRPIEVETLTVDAFVLRESVGRIDLVKIDVEGYEHQVIEGMVETLVRDRPSVLLEFLPRLGDRAASPVHTLIEMGYTLLHLTESGPRIAKRAAPSPASRNVMLCHRREHIDALLR